MALAIKPYWLKIYSLRHLFIFLDISGIYSWKYYSVLNFFFYFTILNVPLNMKETNSGDGINIHSKEFVILMLKIE